MFVAAATLRVVQDRVRGGRWKRRERGRTFAIFQRMKLKTIYAAAPAEAAQQFNTSTPYNGKHEYINHTLDEQCNADGT